MLGGGRWQKPPSSPESLSSFARWKVRCSLVASMRFESLLPSTGSRTMEAAPLDQQMERCAQGKRQGLRRASCAKLPQGMRMRARLRFIPFQRPPATRCERKQRRKQHRNHRTAPITEKLKRVPKRKPAPAAPAAVSTSRKTQQPLEAFFLPPARIPPGPS